MTAPQLGRDDLLGALRVLQPNRPMGWAEAHAIAERQAALLLDIWCVDAPPVPLYCHHVPARPAR